MHIGQSKTKTVTIFARIAAELEQGSITTSRLSLISCYKWNYICERRIFQELNSLSAKVIRFYDSQLCKGGLHQQRIELHIALQRCGHLIGRTTAYAASQTLKCGVAIWSNSPPGLTCLVVRSLSLAIQPRPVASPHRFQRPPFSFWRLRPGTTQSAVKSACPTGAWR